MFDWTSSQFFVKQLCNGEYALVAFQQDSQLGSTVSACYGVEVGFWLFFILNPNHQMFRLSHYGEFIHLEHALN